jgi:hypothetical protein
VIFVIRDFVLIHWAEVPMEKSEMDAVRASIIAEYTAQIDKLKEEMNAELVVFDKVVQRFEVVAGRPVGQKSRRTLPPGLQPEAKPPLGRDRITAAKKTISGRFSRKKLHDTVNNDGYGEMKLGTFSPYVSELIGKEIIEVQKAAGNEPAVYMWAEEYEKLQAESAPKTCPDLF